MSIEVKRLDEKRFIIEFSDDKLQLLEGLVDGFSPYGSDREEFMLGFISHLVDTGMENYNGSSNISLLNESNDDNIFNNIHYDPDISEAPF